MSAIYANFMNYENLSGDINKTGRSRIQQLPCSI